MKIAHSPGMTDKSFVIIFYTSEVPTYRVIINECPKV